MNLVTALFERFDFFGMLSTIVVSVLLIQHYEKEWHDEKIEEDFIIESTTLYKIIFKLYHSKNTDSEILELSDKLNLQIIRMIIPANKKTYEHLAKKDAFFNDLYNSVTNLQRTNHLVAEQEENDDCRLKDLSKELNKSRQDFLNVIIQRMDDQLN